MFVVELGAGECRVAALLTDSLELLLLNLSLLLLMYKHFLYFWTYQCLCLIFSVMLGSFKIWELNFFLTIWLFSITAISSVHGC